MITGSLLSVDNQTCLIPNVRKTTNFLERMQGLLFKPPLQKDEALLISPCNSVHMFGMTYPIDLIFIDKNWFVLKLVNCLKPWQISSCNKAKMVIELTANSLEIIPIKTGQQLEWVNER